MALLYSGDLRISVIGGIFDPTLTVRIKCPTCDCCPKCKTFRTNVKVPAINPELPRDEVFDLVARKALNRSPSELVDHCSMADQGTFHISNSYQSAWSGKDRFNSPKRNRRMTLSLNDILQAFISLSGAEHLHDHIDRDTARIRTISSPDGELTHVIEWEGFPKESPEYKGSY